MRCFALAALAAVALAGCGDAVAKAKPAVITGPAAEDPPSPTPREIAATPAEVVHRAEIIGALEHPASLKRFFESLARVESNAADDDVRVVQFGDSHTAADLETAVIRRALQARFGDGGRGFVAIGKPWKGYGQDGVKFGKLGDWATAKAKKDGDGLYGLGGVGLATKVHSARAWVDVGQHTARAEVDYLEQPGGGSFDVVVDGMQIVRVSTKGDQSTSAFRAFDVTEMSAHQLEVRAVGDGDVRVFGVLLDRAQHGVVYDALGINGARVTTCLSWNEQHWAEQLKHRAPALVVLAYGTNESTDESMAAETYERQLVDALGRVARAVPTASCLLLGPPDRAVDPSKSGSWATAQKLVDVIASQRRVAEAAGCAFYSQLDAMGGEGTIAGWALEDPPRAQKDRVHLTRDGYAQLGASFSSDLMRAYAAWRKDSGLAPTAPRAPSSPEGAPSPAPASAAPSASDIAD